MYTYLLLLSSLFSFKAFTDDDAILAQSAAASAMGAVYVLFHPRLVNGLLGHPHAGDPRSVGAIHRRDGRGAVWSVGGVDERYSLLGVAGEALWHPQGHPHHHVLRRAWHAGAQPALWVTSAPLFAFGLAIFGASFGSAEVAINVEGAAIEREMNKTVLPMMHGFYSFGTLFGAGVGMAVTGFGLPAAPHILAAALVAILPIAIAIRAIPDGTGKNAAEVAHGEAKGLPVWRDAQLLLIGVIVLAMAFAEGSANDWLPLLMVDGHGFSPTSGSLIYAGFTLGMTLGRFTGGWFIDRYSRVAVVRGSAVMGALGIGLIIFVDNPWVAGISVLLWGIGASLGFPLTISAASDTGPDAPKRVSVVAITGYLAFLVGPPLLGFLGEHFGLRSAMMVVLGLVMVAALVARAVAKPQSEPVMENS